MLAVTGSLQFYGASVDNVWTKLKSIAERGSKSIQVIDEVDWKVGNKIVIAPTYDGQTEYEEVTITAVDKNKISFTPAL